MANEQVIELIDSIVDDNPVDSEKIFSSIMADKISDRLQDYRKEVASSFFNPVEAGVDTQEDATE